MMKIELWAILVHYNKNKDYNVSSEGYMTSDEAIKAIKKKIKKEHLKISNCFTFIDTYNNITYELKHIKVNCENYN